MIPIADSNGILSYNWIATSTAATGSIIYYNGSSYQNLGIGSTSTGQILVVSSSLPVWKNQILMATSTGTATTTLRTSNDAISSTGAGVTTYTKVKETRLSIGGRIVVSYDYCEGANTANEAVFKVYIDGYGVGTEQTVNETTCIYHTFAEAFTVAQGSLIQVYAYHVNSGGGEQTNTKNFRIYYDYTLGEPSYRNNL
jgi:hypothetical protein